MVGEGYESHISISLRKIIDEWEAQDVVEQPTDPQINGKINHYWIVKNLLAQLIMHNKTKFNLDKDLVSDIEQSLNHAHIDLNLLSTMLDLAVDVGLEDQGQPSMTDDDGEMEDQQQEVQGTFNPKGKHDLEQLHGPLDNQALGYQFKVYTKKTQHVDLDKLQLQFKWEGCPTKILDDGRTRGSSEESHDASDSLNSHATTLA